MRASGEDKKAGIWMFRFSLRNRSTFIFQSSAVSKGCPFSFAFLKSLWTGYVLFTFSMMTNPLFTLFLL